MEKQLNKHPDYWLFHSMKKRCLNPDHIAYRFYGGKGVKVCDRWLEPRGKGFKNFLADMGERPEGMTLDRIDGNGDYEPANCRWATREQQYSNRANNVYIEFNGEKLTATQWAKRIGVRGGDVILKRLKKFPIEIALTVPNLANPSAYIDKAIDAAAQKKRQQENCKRGHPLSGDNLYIGSNGYRTCRTCKREAMRGYRHPGDKC